MKLYVSDGAPNPRRVLMFASEKGVLDHLELTPVSIMARENMSDTYRAKSPFGEVPSLELPTGEVLTESPAIIRYLDTLAETPNLLGRSAEERAIVDMWDRRMEFRLFIPCALYVRHTAPFMKGVENQSADVAARHRERFEKTLAWLESHMEGRDWIAADRLTVADLTAIAGLDFGRLGGVQTPADTHPNLARWRAAMAERPSAMMGLPPRQTIS